MKSTENLKTDNVTYKFKKYDPHSDSLIPHPTAHNTIGRSDLP